MTLDLQIDNHDHHIMADGKHKMIQNGDDQLQTHQRQMVDEQQKFEENDLVRLDIMFLAQKIGRICVIQLFDLLVQMLCDIIQI
jgi:hypothetical protein